MIATQVPPFELKLDIERKPSSALLRAKGKINGAATEVLNSAFRGLIPEARNIVLDLTGVNYVDVAGMNTLLGLFISAQRAGCELELSNGTRAEWPVLTLMWLKLNAVIRHVADRSSWPTAAGRRPVGSDCDPLPFRSVRG